MRRPSVRASEAEEHAAWCLWLWLRLGGAAPGCDLDAALREFRAAGWGEAEFRRALEIARAAGARPRGKRERPDDKSNGEGPQ